eukprot:CAMPEP_0113997474 /NCGR_PEP_ID=MMETSP0328-20130328/12316_1 /TAXON_ID=39455 /ORGANISM="Alexandrium minutum" /LENGTH=43 /assembly_acc=CAM_ASM_000350
MYRRLYNTRTRERPGAGVMLEENCKRPASSSSETAGEAATQAV